MGHYPGYEEKIQIAADNIDNSCSTFGRDEGRGIIGLAKQILSTLELTKAAWQTLKSQNDEAEKWLGVERSNAKYWYKMYLSVIDDYSEQKRLITRLRTEIADLQNGLGDAGKAKTDMAQRLYNILDDLQYIIDRDNDKGDC